MKEIKAIIRPFKVDEIITKLHAIEEFSGFTVSEVKVFGKTQKSIGGTETVLKSKVEIVIQDELVETVIKIIQRYAFTGNFGDGKIFIYDVKNIVKIGSAAHGESAI